MTTVAANRKEMAADRLVAGGSFSYHCTKLFRIRGNIVGVAGNVGLTTKFLAWYRKECPADEIGMTLDEDNSFIGLVLTSTGKLLVYADCTEPDEIDDKFIAIGSGCDYAVAALACGKSPHDAVRIAAKYDINTGGKIDVLSPTQKAKTKSKKRLTKRTASGIIVPADTAIESVVESVPALTQHKKENDADLQG